MTLKEEFEFLRGRPIEFKKDPAEIPCNETSDRDRLCRNPVVSVRMITYKHEKFIRQAVESVMAQETNFEYELVIGEDASPDRTREICFELQKKYPDRIRVLWSEKNLGNINSNSARVLSRCRGEFLAMLEGDDFWTDTHKLQKQVDAMMAHPNVVLCFGEKRDLIESSGRIREAHSVARAYPAGIIKREAFLTTHALVPPFTALYRASALKAMYAKYDLFSWSLSLGDLQLWRGLAQFGDVYVFHDLFATYRVQAGGVMHTMPLQIGVDAGIVRMYFARMIPEMPAFYYEEGLHGLLVNRCVQIASVKGVRNRLKSLFDIINACPSVMTGLQHIGYCGLGLVICGVSPRGVLRIRDGIYRRWHRWLMRILAQ